MNYYACSFMFFIVIIYYFKDNIYICTKYCFKVAFNKTFQHIGIYHSHPPLYGKRLKSLVFQFDEVEVEVTGEYNTTSSIVKIMELAAVY